MNKAVILSAKYAPGHFSHMLAYDRLFRAIGCQPTMLLDDGYESFQKVYTGYHYTTFKEIRSVQADILLIYNMSTKDVKYIRILKKNNPDILFIFCMYYHDGLFFYLLYLFVVCGYMWIEKDKLLEMLDKMTHPKEKKHGKV